MFKFFKRKPKPQAEAPQVQTDEPLVYNILDANDKVVDTAGTHHEAMNVVTYYFRKYPSQAPYRTAPAA